MERRAQEGSSNRWYVVEGHRVVAGPYEEQLAKRLVATWNRREARRAAQAGQETLPTPMPLVQSRGLREAARRAPRAQEQATSPSGPAEAPRSPETAPGAAWARAIVEELPRPVSRFEEVLSRVPVEHQAIVGLHAQLLLNTGGGRPSDAARRAVADFERIGPEGFAQEHRREHDSALRACPCPACRADSARLT